MSMTDAERVAREIVEAWKRDYFGTPRDDGLLEGRIAAALQARNEEIERLKESLVMQTRGDRNMAYSGGVKSPAVSRLDFIDHLDVLKQTCGQVQPLATYEGNLGALDSLMSLYQACEQVMADIAHLIDPAS